MCRLVHNTTALTTTGYNTRLACDRHKGMKIHIETSKQKQATERPTATIPTAMGAGNPVHIPQSPPKPQVWKLTPSPSSTVSSASQCSSSPAQSSHITPYGRSSWYVVPRSFKQSSLWSNELRTALRRRLPRPPITFPTTRLGHSHTSHTALTRRRSRWQLPQRGHGAE
jgi:hypothetical protein